MAPRTKSTDQKDVIAELADVGEDTLRRLVELPRRIVAGTMDNVGRRLQGVAMKLGAVDPLDGRVGALEKRLDALEKPRQKTPRTASSRAAPPIDRKASRAPTPEPEQTRPDSGRADDARMGHEPEQGEVPA